ncbi:MAG: prepilin-type N-terminal cleavage/methylation domain-containing protein [Candidatus Omnitrophica bacterium]|nr:prepilin-type N-terminal cleavage/methylation domain-containing protein [Candidatus Omnitrophota bacterium]
MKRCALLKGFTLLELMTVMTIIGVLSAIAVPNFLNAVYRARVARAQAEIETIIWALEMYNVDEDAYPLNAEPGVSSPGDLASLTTPVPYMSSIPYDIFIAPSKYERKQFIQSERNGNPYYFYINFLQTNGQRISLKPYGLEGSANYLIYGLGPSYTTDYDPLSPASFQLYSPSNGMMSRGVMGSFAP